MKLPTGMLNRSEKREFGHCLTVHVISRQDQVALKLYAAIDRKKGQRHVKDLVAIKPTRREMEFAVHWLLDRKTSSDFVRAVRKISEALGFSELRAFTLLGPTDAIPLQGRAPKVEKGKIKSRKEKQSPL